MSFGPEQHQAAAQLVDERWGEIVPVLHDFIAIPNLSPHFDPEWREHGHMQRAVDLVAAWCRSRDLPGLTVEVHELAGRTPVVVVEVPATGGGPTDDTVLLYGHLDKQPEMEGWRSDLGPWTPVLEGDRLYGRGGADDGYSAFAALGAKPARSRARPTCRRMWKPWRTGSGRRASSSASTRVASTATGCG
jgi:acetylornithine deacetylase/succinyl-diaminopimelate desuccinylase-like protein